MASRPRSDPWYRAPTNRCHRCYPLAALTTNLRFIPPVEPSVSVGMGLGTLQQSSYGLLSGWDAGLLAESAPPPAPPPPSLPPHRTTPLPPAPLPCALALFSLSFLLSHAGHLAPTVLYRAGYRAGTYHRFTERDLQVQLTRESAEERERVLRG